MEAVKIATGHFQPSLGQIGVFPTFGLALFKRFEKIHFTEDPGKF